MPGVSQNRLPTKRVLLTRLSGKPGLIGAAAGHAILHLGRRVAVGIVAGPEGDDDAHGLEGAVQLHCGRCLGRPGEKAVSACCDQRCQKHTLDLHLEPPAFQLLARPSGIGAFSGRRPGAEYGTSGGGHWALAAQLADAD